MKLLAKGLGFFNLAKSKTELWLKGSSNTATLSHLLVSAALLVVFIVFIALSLLLFSIAYNLITSTEVATFKPFDVMGPFGDFIGGFLNPILTFLMFMGVLVTIVIQSKELKETRKEIKNQAESNKEHVSILRKQDKRKQLLDAFNEARDRYWELAKEKISDAGSIYDLVLYDDELPDEKHYEVQLKYINRKLNIITNLTVQLLPETSKPVQTSIISEIEDIFTFAIEAKILSEEDMKVHLDKLDKVTSVSSTRAGGLFGKIVEMFGNS